MWPIFARIIFKYVKNNFFFFVSCIDVNHTTNQTTTKRTTESNVQKYELKVIIYSYIDTVLPMLLMYLKVSSAFNVY